MSFFSTKWVSQEEVGGLHPSSTNDPLGGASATELARQYRMVHQAMQTGVLDPQKIMVVPHPERTDIWYVRYRNAAHNTFKDGEIVGWLVFNYHSKRGKGDSICAFPENPPIIGMLTPTHVFTNETGSKWLCLAGYSGGTLIGQKEAMQAWQAMYHDNLTPQGKSTFTSAGSGTVQADGGHHFKRSMFFAKLEGTMVNYLLVLQSQFEYGMWLNLILEDAGDHGGPDGFTAKGKLLKLLANGTVEQAMNDSAAWNRQHLGPIMDLFDQAEQALPPPPPAPAPPDPAAPAPVPAPPAMPPVQPPQAATPVKSEVKLEDEVKVEVKEESEAGPQPKTESAPVKRRRYVKDDDDAVPATLQRPRRMPPAAKVKLSLQDFPPGTRIFTPRRDVEGGGSWCKVLKHDSGQLRVAVPDEPTALVSLDFLAKRQEQGLPIRAK